MRARARAGESCPLRASGTWSAIEHTPTISGTNGVGSTNSIGTNTSWVGAVHALPTGYRTRSAARYATTVTTRAATEKERAEVANAASAIAAAIKAMAADASVIRRR